MQYLHSAKYGHPGGNHTMKPLFVKKGEHIFKSEYHPDVVADKSEGDKAQYVVRGDKVYASAAHPEAQNPHALFEIRGNKIHTTMNHPEHNPSQHVFEIGKEKMDPNFIDRVIKNA